MYGPTASIARASFGSAARNAATAAVADRAVSARGVRGAGIERPTAGTDYMLMLNMMCAFGVPGNMSHGELAEGTVLNPVLFSVANGM